MNSPVEEIKSRLDLVEFIQSYLRLQKSGINYRALCPFHSEKTPSFFVSPSRQIWHCFGGCGKGGDIFKFVMEIEGLEFPEALRLLAERAGVKLVREDPVLRTERNRLYDIIEGAAQVFEKNLFLTPSAKNYLKKRGVNDETLQEFRLGFAPQSWDFLFKALVQRGFKKEEIEKAGLAIKSEDGTSWYDRFRSRIVFPIADINGRVVGFSGRIFEQPTAVSKQQTVNSKQLTTEAKYVNTPSTLIYDKSRVLYGFDKAKQEIRTKNQAVLVEGQMDCIMSHQAGIKNTIAVSGTALTPGQLKILRRLCDTIISSFDTDAAGDSATKRSLQLVSQFEFEQKIVLIPSGKDPADTILENPELWRAAIADAKPVIEFYFEKMFREENPQSVAGKKAISSTLLPLVGELANEVEKAHWLGLLAQRLEVREEALWEQLKRSKSENFPPWSGLEVMPESRKAPTRRDLLEERLLALLTLVRAEIRSRELEKHNLAFATVVNTKLFEMLKGGGTPQEVGVVALSQPLELLKFKAEVLSQITPDIEEEFLACKRELEKECVKERLLQIGAEIEKKEKEGNQQVVLSLLQDFRTLSEKLKALS